MTMYPPDYVRTARYRVAFEPTGHLRVYAADGSTVVHEVAGVVPSGQQDYRVEVDENRTLKAYVNEVLVGTFDMSEFAAHNTIGVRAQNLVDAVHITQEEGVADESGVTAQELLALMETGDNMLITITAGGKLRFDLLGGSGPGDQIRLSDEKAVPVARLRTPALGLGGNHPFAPTLYGVLTADHDGVLYGIQNAGAQPNGSVLRVWNFGSTDYELSSSGPVNLGSTSQDVLLNNPVPYTAGQTLVIGLDGKGSTVNAANLVPPISIPGFTWVSARYGGTNIYPENIYESNMVPTWTLLTVNGVLGQKTVIGPLDPQDFPVVETDADLNDGDIAYVIQTGLISRKADGVVTPVLGGGGGGGGGDPEIQLVSHDASKSRVTSFSGSALPSGFTVTPGQESLVSVSGDALRFSGTAAVQSGLSALNGYVEGVLSQNTGLLWRIQPNGHHYHLVRQSDGQVALWYYNGFHNNMGYMPDVPDATVLYGVAFSGDNVKVFRGAGQIGDFTTTAIPGAGVFGVEGYVGGYVEQYAAYQEGAVTISGLPSGYTFTPATVARSSTITLKDADGATVAIKDNVLPGDVLRYQLSSGGGGGSGGGAPLAYSASRDTDLTLNPFPVSHTSVLSVNIPASSTARRFLVTYTGRAMGDQFRVRASVDADVDPYAVGSSVSPYHLTSTHPENFQLFQDAIILTVPGDNQPHTIDITANAHLNTNPRTFKNIALSAIDLTTPTSSGGSGSEKPPEFPQQYLSTLGDVGFAPPGKGTGTDSWRFTGPVITAPVAAKSFSRVRVPLRNSQSGDVLTIARLRGTDGYVLGREDITLSAAQTEAVWNEEFTVAQGESVVIVAGFNAGDYGTYIDRFYSKDPAFAWSYTRSDGIMAAEGANYSLAIDQSRHRLIYVDALNNSKTVIGPLDPKDVPQLAVDADIPEGGAAIVGGQWKVKKNGSVAVVGGGGSTVFGRVTSHQTQNIPSNGGAWIQATTLDDVTAPAGGAMIANQFTAPSAGLYDVRAKAAFFNIVAGQDCGLAVQRNGAFKIVEVTSAGGPNFTTFISDLMQLQQGDVLTVWIKSSAAASTYGHADADYTTLSVRRVGD